MAETDLSLAIEAAILQGATRAIVEVELSRTAAASGTPAAAPTEINAAYARILDRWIADANQDEEQTHAYHVRLRKHLYQKSFALNDFKTCLAIAGDLAKLQEHQQDRTRARKTELERQAMMNRGNQK